MWGAEGLEKSIGHPTFESLLKIPHYHAHCHDEGIRAVRVSHKSIKYANYDIKFVDKLNITGNGFRAFQNKIIIILDLQQDYSWNTFTVMLSPHIPIIVKFPMASVQNVIFT